MDEEQRRPSWLSWTNLAAGVQVTAVVGGLAFFIVTIANKTDTTVAAQVAVNTRLDRISEKLEGLSVLLDQVRRLERGVSDRDQQLGSLDGRLRTVEQKSEVNAAQISDLVAASKQRLR